MEILQENSGLVEYLMMMQMLKLMKLRTMNHWLHKVLNLSEDQSKQGGICNLYGDSKKKKENKDVTKNTADDKN